MEVVKPNFSNEKPQQIYMDYFFQIKGSVLFKQLKNDFEEVFCLK